jgi:flagellar protein FlaG
MDIRQVGSTAPGATLPQTRPAAPAPATTTAAPAADAKASGSAQQQLEEAVKQLNKTVASMNTGIEFSIDKDTKEHVVKVIDQDTKEVLRQIPTEETLQIAKALDKLQGLLIKQEA